MTQDAYKACQLISNPDISGTGVRVAFYVQAILTGILAFAPKADFNASYWSMNITSFALFISALSLHSMQQLSLYQAILVINLLYVHSFVAFTCVWPLYNGPHFQRRVMAAASTGETAILAVREWWRISLRMLPLISITSIFGLIIWVDPSNFGFQPECNSQTVFSFLGIPLPATGTGRIAGLVLVGLQGYTMMVTVIIDIVLLVLSAYFSNPTRRPAFLTNPTPRALLEGPASESQVELSMSDSFHTHLYIHEDGRKYKVEPFVEKWCLPILGIVFVSIFLITAERTIVDNERLIQSGDIDSTWTLGQIFPLVMVGVPVTSLAKVSIRSCRARRKKAKRFAEMSKNPVVGLHVKDWHDHLTLEEG